MLKVQLFILGLFVFFLNQIHSQDTNVAEKISSPKVLGYHFGVVQIAFAINKGDVIYLDKYDFYTIGFPFGISLKTPGKAIIDLEFVPVIKPYLTTETPYNVHLLYHPGILYPLKKGWTLGFRLAFESGEKQFGFTPLINKAFRINEGSVFFVELVAPGRFGPAKNSGYTQLGGLHLGFGF